MALVLLARAQSRYRSILAEQVADMERALIGDPTSSYFKGRLEAFQLSLQLMDELSDEMPE